MNFCKANNLFAWICCGIATFIYLVTIEPTVSFWDCGEFLSCAAKLEVAHSPGAPLFMLIQRVVSLLAFGNKQNIALVINAWSAMAAGLTILFLFWTITYFAKRIITKVAEPDRNQTISIIACGIAGNLAYAFSDTFWYSAVEAEVYATSSLFTAIVFWAITRWERDADSDSADKWLLLIAYLIGLSVGIHLLCLLAVPAIVMVYYYKRYNISLGNTVVALLIGAGLLVFVQIGILQVLPMLAKSFELFFVNSAGMPFNTGVWVFLLLLIAFLVGLLTYARRKANYILHTATLFVVFIIIGFSSYFVPIMRSRANVPIDNINPDNVVNLVSYLNREHYTQQPLIYGPDFTSIRTGWEQTDAEYVPVKEAGKDRYKIQGYRKVPVFQEGTQRLFPRLWDVKSGEQIGFYRRYLNIPDNEVATSDDNMKFFFKYQLSWMWWRYLMWNYAGRQNDMEGQGDPKNGNWISGISFIDNNLRGLGDMNKMGDGYKNNAARNQLYLLPFVLGIIGLVCQFMKNRRDATVIAVLFFYTGIALAIYLNMGPMQARERDYAFAGCTYAFAIWIGLGVILVAEWMQKLVKNPNATYLAGGICLLAVPVLMLKEEWNDHNRSGKTLAHATAYNTLASCAPNAVLFTFGDNYTYPLWYMQEVEEFRRDVRVINLGLLEGTWYIDQLNYKINDADAVPMLWKNSEYTDPSAAAFVYNENPQIPKDKYFSLAEICRFMANDKNMQSMGDEPMRYYPSKNFYLPSLTKQQILQAGLSNITDTAGISNEMKFTCPRNKISRGTVAMYNIIAAIANEGWRRPIYFGDGITADDMAGMQDYVRLEGCVYHLLPFKYVNDKPEEGMTGIVDPAKSFALMMNKYQWGGAERNNVYFDAKNRLALTTYRINAGRIAAALVNKGEKQKALALLDQVTKMITEHSYFYDATMYYIAMGYYQAGATDKGSAIALKIAKNSADDVKYINSLSDDGIDALTPEMKGDLSMIKALGKVAMSHGDMNTANALMRRYQEVMKQE